MILEGKKYNWFSGNGVFLSGQNIVLIGLWNFTAVNSKNHWNDKAGLLWFTG